MNPDPVYVPAPWNPYDYVRPGETYEEYIAEGKAIIAHAENHDAAGTDPELCEEDDCPHWPAWWAKGDAHD